jgi:hypothetical protein
VLSTVEVLSFELAVGRRMRNVEFEMRNGLNRNAERGVLSLVPNNSDLTTQNSAKPARLERH